MKNIILFIDKETLSVVYRYLCSESERTAAGEIPLPLLPKEEAHMNIFFKYIEKKLGQDPKSIMKAILKGRERDES